MWASFLAVACAGGAGFLVWGYPHYQTQRRCANERSATAALKALATAEACFRANDSDGNGVQDFWTGDVAGLYRFGLIDRSLAEADLRPLLPLVPHPIPMNGYYFVALDFDASCEPPEEYRKDTDGKSGKVHHERAFGFQAIPARPGVSGKPTFIINEGNSLFMTRSARKVIAWPTDALLKSFWSHAG